MKKILLIVGFFISIYSFSQNFDYTSYNNFLSKYVSANGNTNYEKIKKNKSELETIIIRFERMHPTERWSTAEKMAYWINSYNLHTIKIVVDNYPLKSIKDIPNVWENDFILSVNKKISLSEIENRILRKMDQPKIHFAINCASISCPILNNEAFLPEKLEKQLNQVTKDFVNDKSKNIITKKEVVISNIFNWYAVDFKDYGSIIDFLNKYSRIKIDPNAKVRFMDYNWNLNK